MLGEAKSLLTIMVPVRSQELHRVQNINVGADDHVVNPYSIEKLFAGIKAQLWRACAAAIGERR